MEDKTEDSVAFRIEFMQDYLSIDSYYRVCEERSVYKAKNQAVEEEGGYNAVVFVCRSYPYRLMKHLREERKLRIESRESGIYLIVGESCPIKLVVTSRLSTKNTW